MNGSLGLKIASADFPRDQEKEVINPFDWLLESAFIPLIF
jgi:hypothetical protein